MRIVLLAAVVATGCTTLGPLPTTTGVSAVPAGRADVELTLGSVPGSYLSSGTTPDPKGSSIAELLGVFEGHGFLPSGLILALRWVEGENGDGFGEPIIGVRGALSDRLSGAVVVFGTHASGSSDRATYSLNRFGAEVVGDLRVTPKNPWAELHVTLGGSLTALDGDGAACFDEAGYGVTCSDSDTPLALHASGAYYAVNASVAVELFRHRSSYFHGLRAALALAGGTVPTLRGGVQSDAAVFTALGLTMSVALGSGD